jgi:siroheme synthase-like protein
MNDLRFPMFISLDNKKIVIFGGGKVAYRRANTLLLFHAEITVVTPQMCEDMGNLVSSNPIQLIKENYDENYINKDTFMVIAATNDNMVNEKIYNKCKETNILVNNASNQLQCDFFFPAIVLDDEIVVGVSGNGNNHKEVRNYAAKMREEIKKKMKFID